VESLVDYLHRVVQYDDMGWVVVELLSIGLVVYWVVNFLEGTRGERLFRGIIFVLIICIVVPIILRLAEDRLPLVRVQILFKPFLIGLLIVAVAAFQPELRRVLMRLGRPRIWSGASQQLSETIDEVIKAAVQLSGTRTGAIVVVEGHVALGEFIETGVRIDALVTADLLKTVFYPGTSLHDMAVVIRDDRIIAARVQLPLAEAGTLKTIVEGHSVTAITHEGQLGSRHRAAVGITMGSDAICLVVSEETGSISIAKDGKLNRNMTEPQLRSHLLGTLTQVETTGLKRWLEALTKRHRLSENA
jgi:diadenylate cyclase